MYKSMKKKMQMIEQTLKENSPIQQINTPADIKDLAVFLKIIHDRSIQPSISNFANATSSGLIETHSQEIDQKDKVP